MDDEILIDELNERIDNLLELLGESYELFEKCEDALDDLGYSTLANEVFRLRKQIKKVL